MEDFIERYKAEVLDEEGAPECMKISGYMHGITHPELIKRLYEKIPRSMDEMYRVTKSFLQGEVAAFSHSQKKAPAPWRQPEEGNKPNFKKGFKNKQRSDRKPDMFSLLTKTPKEIFTLENRKFKAPPPMLRKPGKLSQFIKELKQNDKPKAQKKGETARKDKLLAILMIQPWERVAKQRVTQSFSPEIVISFPSLGEEDETKGPMIIEAEIGGTSYIEPNLEVKLCVIQEFMNDALDSALDSDDRIELIQAESDPTWFILTGHSLQRREFQQIIRRLKGQDTFNREVKAVDGTIPATPYHKLTRFLDIGEDEIDEFVNDALDSALDSDDMEDEIDEELDRVLIATFDSDDRCYSRVCE
ncbi:hypothetical protein Tco_0940281 [Tanacetum coccineum]|uniref:Reverse transcriptase domain-containing protein n=1 Tax=Tanacetum coccineum TaxID=301880 RepID=A0ABQ5DMK3_9ASTR